MADHFPPPYSSYSTSRTTSCSTYTTTTPTVTEPGSPTSSSKYLNPTPPGTFVIQIPRDQIYKIPPPENAKRFQQLSKSKSPARQSHCCGPLCFWASFSIASAFLFLLAVSAAAFYLVVRPESPNYRVDSASIRGFDSSPVSPEFEFSVRVHNRNRKMEMYHRAGSSAAVYYDGIELAGGSVPVFEMGKSEARMVKTALKGTGIVFTSAVRRSLSEGEKKGMVALRLRLTAPLKFRLGAVKSWTIAANVDCDVTVDELTANARVVKQKCDYAADIFGI